MNVLHGRDYIIIKLYAIIPSKKKQQQTGHCNIQAADAHTTGIKEQNIRQWTEFKQSAMVLR